MAPTKHPTPPGFHADLPERLAEAGYAPATAEALLEFDATMFHWHRWSAKGELPRLLVAEMGLDIDLAAFHAMTAIHRIENGIGRTAEPATVGLVAEEMAIDPSRASRLTTGLIQSGHVRREVDQEDGRKAVLVLTDKARAIFTEFRDRKWAKMLEVFGDWNEADILLFSKLFSRYSDDLKRVYLGEG